MGLKDENTDARGYYLSLWYCMVAPARVLSWGSIWAPVPVFRRYTVSLFTKGAADSGFIPLTRVFPMSSHLTLINSPVKLVLLSPPLYHCETEVQMWLPRGHMAREERSIW